MDLKDVSAIVTGGASGIGEATVRSLVDRGAKVVIADLNEQAGNALAESLGATFVSTDVSDEASATAAVEAAEGLGPLRVLVNSAGLGSSARTVSRDGEVFPLDKFERVLRVNLVGTFNMIRLAARAIGRTEPVDADGARGAIVNMSSVAAFDGQIGQAAYSASKGGIVGLTLPVARDLSSLGIRVNTVAPGLIDTPIYGSGERSDEFKAKLGASVLFPPRLGRPEELASVVIELLTNDYANGEVVRLDGGIRMPPR